MGMLEPAIVQIEPVLWPGVMMPDGHTLCESIRGVRCILLPSPVAREPSDGRTIPIIACAEVPLDDAHRLSRGPRMALESYHALNQNIQALDTTAPRLTVGEEIGLR
jgi:hypothetical protein